ncbi:VirB3 family type IV secretion system protein [Skermanella sp. TT6]|uniref:VirB3 family type IV secretion system protein n=1 Tax=Skermanella cutis TaxID=2775420 RepID=A0ABX7B6B4_9PROT|nr:VirB3 family type IV secretion system protein [Skermanella sp. TT6]QQP89904.1 VirB3 family type IV secretion system protein [Skermanella sp. TT6]
MAGDDVPGFRITLHQSLLEPVTIKGVARVPAILIGTVGALLVFSLHKVTGGVLLTVGLWTVARHLTGIDPHMFDFITRRARARLPFLGG